MECVNPTGARKAKLKTLPGIPESRRTGVEGPGVRVRDEDVAGIGGPFDGLKPGPGEVVAQPGIDAIAATPRGYREQQQHTGRIRQQPR